MPHTFNDETVVEKGTQPISSGVARPPLKPPRKPREKLQGPPLHKMALIALFVGFLALLGVSIYLVQRISLIQKSPDELLNRLVSQEQDAALQNEEHLKAVAAQRDQALKRLEELSGEQGAHEDRIKEALSKNLVTQAFTSSELDGFALWSKGRFAVTGLSGDDLLFEVNPSKGKTHVSGALGVHGNTSIAGSLESESFTSLGGVVGSFFSTGKFSVNESGELIAQKAQVEDASVTTLAGGDIQADNLRTQTLAAQDIQVDTLRTSQKLEIPSVVTQEVQTATLACSGDATIQGGLRAATLEAPKVSADKVEASELTAQSVRAQNLGADEIEAQQVKGVQVAAEDGGFTNLEADDIAVQEVDAKSLWADELHATSARIDEVDTRLASLRLNEENVGVVQFAPPVPGQTSHVQQVDIPTPPHTLAVFTSVSAQDTNAPAVVGVLQQGDTYSLVCRFPPDTDATAPLRVVWLALVG